MSRPVRIEFEGALYHVTSRGDQREPRYKDENDRSAFLDFLGEVAETANWMCHAYRLITNHYHLVIETPYGNLSKGMRQTNHLFYSFVKATVAYIIYIWLISYYINVVSQI